MADTDKNTMAEGMGAALEETPAGHDQGKGEPDLARGMGQAGAGRASSEGGGTGARTEQDIARGMDEAGKR